MDESCVCVLSSQLYDLMTMAFKYQVLLCARPKDLLLVSFNHMDAIKDFVKDTPSILSQVDETYQQLIEVKYNMCDFSLLTFVMEKWVATLHLACWGFLKYAARSFSFWWCVN